MAIQNLLEKLKKVSQTLEVIGLSEIVDELEKECNSLLATAQKQGKALVTAKRTIGDIQLHLGEAEKTIDNFEDISTDFLSPKETDALIQAIFPNKNLE